MIIKYNNYYTQRKLIAICEWCDRVYLSLIYYDSIYAIYSFR